MALPGETLLTGAADCCCECGTKYKREVMATLGGYYIGTTCRDQYCEAYLYPYTRESIYYSSRVSAQRELEAGTWQIRF